ncbi:mechanosensitive ion channel family protein [Haloarcula nitratireducens]|uniref:Mechanosensitive ion channel family protein n=1 Tax=Haloarcula nitratireducens TaxID=2487749 RepID=A0AAW4P9P6_9EURY|nr:mechanosensitive ion channel family protein [Halomicroarcula nitratireducens]MBX0294801.1 mechanosensitive ion channel family protein [Halomicroarcula nitratireducens]
MQGTAVPTPESEITGERIVEFIAELQELLQRLEATRGRLTATILLVLVLFLSIVVAPALFSEFRGALGDWMRSGRMGRGLERLASLTPTSSRGVLLRSLQLTALCLVVVSFLIVWDLVDVVDVAAPIILEGSPKLYATAQSVLLVLLGFVLSDQLKRSIDRLSLALDDFTEHQEEILLRVGQVTISIVIGVTILAIWGLDISGLLVGAGFLGIVVGFAARTTLGSLIAGFVLMFSRPFTIGDWVVIGEQEGIVTEITVFNTRLENFDGEFVVIPNDRVGDQAVTNRSQKGLLRLTMDLGVDYDTDVERATELAQETMAAVEEVVDSPPPQVVPKSFGDSAIVLELRFWIDHPTPPRKWRAISAVVREVKAAFDEEGISIPFPQRTLQPRADGEDGAPESVIRSVNESEDGQ